MKSNKKKYIPFIFMLVAGSITSIMTYIFQYEIKAALLVLLSVLLVFYCMWLLLVNVITSFDKKNEVERLAREKELAKAEEERFLEEMNQMDADE